MVGFLKNSLKSYPLGIRASVDIIITLILTTTYPTTKCQKYYIITSNMHSATSVVEVMIYQKPGHKVKVWVDDIEAATALDTSAEKTCLMVS